LESLSVLGSSPALGASKTDSARPQRLVAIGNLLGFYQPEFFPKAPGKAYEMPRLLKPLAPFREDFTLLGGLDHGVKGGHFAVHSFLCGLLQMDAKGMPDSNISLGRVTQTRPELVLVWAC
jgi:hypothetical protein